MILDRDILQELFENKSTDETLNDQFDRYMTDYETATTF